MLFKYIASYQGCMAALLIVSGSCWQQKKTEKWWAHNKIASFFGCYSNVSTQHMLFIEDINQLKPTQPSCLPSDFLWRDVQFSKEKVNAPGKINISTYWRENRSNKIQNDTMWRSKSLFFWRLFLHCCSEGALLLSNASHTTAEAHRLPSVLQDAHKWVPSHTAQDASQRIGAGYCIVLVI